MRSPPVSDQAGGRRICRPAVPATVKLGPMTATRAWELTVPADDAALRDELRRHSVAPGQRVQVVVLDDKAEETPADTLPAFFSSFDGPRDLAARSDEILRSEFPGTR